MAVSLNSDLVPTIIHTYWWLEVDGGLAAEVVAVYSEVTDGDVGHFSASGAAFDEAFLEEEGFVDFLDGATILAEGGGYGRETYGTAAEFVDDSAEELVVNLVKSVAVYVESFKCIPGYLGVDVACSLDLREVTHPAQERIGYTWGASAAERYLMGSFSTAFHTEEFCGAEYDALQQLVVIIFEVAVDAETRPERGCQKSAAGGSTYKSEWRQCQLHRPRAGTLVDGDVYAVVLHGGV